MVLFIIISSCSSITYYSVTKYLEDEIHIV